MGAAPGVASPFLRGLLAGSRDSVWPDRHNQLLVSARFHDTDRRLKEEVGVVFVETD